MFQAPEAASSAAEPATSSQSGSEAAERTVAPVTPAADRRRMPELSEADRRAARQLLGAIFIAAGIAHLTHQRYYRSLLPYWLLEARREIDAATGTVEVFGGVLLFIPKLRKLARWTNLAVLTPGLLAAIGEVRHPSRLSPFTQHRAVLNPVGPLALAPGHAGLAGAVWWATQD